MIALAALILAMQMDSSAYSRSLKEYPTYTTLKPPSAARLDGWSAPHGCAVRFRVPRGWSVTVDRTSSGQELCEILIAPRGLTGDEPCEHRPIRMSVTRRPLADALVAAGFTMYDDKWRYRIGSVFDNGAAEVFRGSGWDAFHGASSSHYCGSAQMTDVFILGTPRASVSIGAHESSRAAIDAILPTLKLAPP